MSRFDLAIVGLGEALFDRFEGQSILGGAPLNLAVHAHAMLAPSGGAGVVASRVGCDPLGDAVHDALKDRQMSPDYLQRDVALPTGTVDVALDENGSPEYAIAADVAWDSMEFDDSWRSLAGRCAAVSFGTLGQRSVASRLAIQSFLHEAKAAVRVCDLNLRQTFFDAKLIGECLNLASVAKLNEEELDVVCETQFDALVPGSPAARGKEVLQRFDLDYLAVTRGSKGTMLLSEEAELEGCVSVESSEPNADSVGAGDASCAGLISGILWAWPLEDTLELANRAGAFVASRVGATPPLSSELIEWIARKREEHGDS